MNKKYQKKLNQSEIIVSAVSYKISIPEEDFEQLSMSDSCEEKPLYELIPEKHDVFNVDYSGHFGSFIYFSVNEEHNSIALREEVVKTIFSFLEKISTKDY